MTVKRGVFFAAALVVGIGVGLILYSAFRQPPPSPLPIVIGRFKTPHSGLVHIAEAKGYSAEEGLTATIKTVLTGHEAITQVLRGEVDVGSTAETPIARALAEGKQPKIIATIFSSRWSSGIVVRKDYGILNPDSPSVLSWVTLIVVGIILGIGLSWSLLRARVTGQVEVD